MLRPLATTVKLLARSARAEGEKVKPTARTSFFNDFESEEAAAAKKFDLKGRKEKELGRCIFSSARERSVFLRPFVLLPGFSAHRPISTFELKHL